MVEDEMLDVQISSSFFIFFLANPGLFPFEFAIHRAQQGVTAYRQSIRNVFDGCVVLRECVSTMVLRRD